MSNTTNSRSRRAMKQKRDIMYDYVDNTGSETEPEKSVKLGEQQKKMADMRLHKEEICCDFWDVWQKLTDLEKRPTG